MARKPEEDRSHPYLIIKETPSSLIELRRLIALPSNLDIYEAAIVASTIEDSLGLIAAKLDIAMDGFYDVVEVCEMLCEAIRNRGSFKSQPHLRAAGLVSVELVEREGSVEIERRTEAEGPYIENTSEDKNP